MARQLILAIAESAQRRRATTKKQSTIGSTTDDRAKLKVPRPKSAKLEPNADRRFKKTSAQPY